MFKHFKSKTKAPSLRIRSHSVDSKGPGQVAETISMASMKLTPQTEPSAVLQDNGLGLFAVACVQVPQPHWPKRC